MADTPEGKTSKASVEASLASKLQVMSIMPRGVQEQALEGYANKALPDGGEQERDEFKRYWREQLYRETEHSDRERERNDREVERQLRMLKSNTVKAQKGLEAADGGPSKAVPAEPAAECTTSAASQSDATTPKPYSGGRNRGPKTDYENASRVAKAVARVAPDGDWRPKLDDICEALDAEGIPCPKTWRAKDRSCRSWVTYPERDHAIKVIEYRLEVANQRKKTTPETLS